MKNLYLALCLTVLVVRAQDDTVADTEMGATDDVSRGFLFYQCEPKLRCLFTDVNLQSLGKCTCAVKTPNKERVRDQIFVLNKKLFRNWNLRLVNGACWDQGDCSVSAVCSAIGGFPIGGFTVLSFLHCVVISAPLGH